MKTLSFVIALFGFTVASGHACSLTPIGSQLLDTRDVALFLGNKRNLWQHRVDAIRFDTKSAPVAVDLTDPNRRRRTMYFAVDRGADCSGTVREVR
jgi:hypothetical protein